VLVLKPVDAQSNRHPPGSGGDVCKMYEDSALRGITERDLTALQDQKTAAQRHTK
jgi:hypothetical protein